MHKKGYVVMEGWLGYTILQLKAALLKCGCLDY